MEAEAEARRRREEAQQQRLAALRSSDMEAYKEMLLATRNERLTKVRLVNACACRACGLRMKLHDTHPQFHAQPARPA
jgi:hypothetical protein